MAKIKNFGETKLTAGKKRIIKSRCTVCDKKLERREGQGWPEYGYVCRKVSCYKAAVSDRTEG